MTNKIKGTKFYGNEVSEYGIENKRVDYKTLAESFNAVLNNDIPEYLSKQGVYLELVNGSEEYEEDDEVYYHEIFQYFIIDNIGYNILSDWTDEIVYYCDELDMYIWGVAHYGTAWDYVLTDIEIED